MAIYANKTNKGFYDSEIHSTIPAGSVVISAVYHRELLDGQSNGQVIDWDTEDGVPVLKTPEKVFKSVDEYTEDFDSFVASIYSRWTRFETEYYEREKAAQEYVDSNYEDEPSVWVTSFANAAGLSNQIAAELILSQAVNLRSGMRELGTLRMRKYEMVPLADQELEDKFIELKQAVTALAALFT